MLLNKDELKIFEENQKLVYFVINKYINTSYSGNIGINDREDLVQIGLIALCKAIKKYDQNRNYKFSVYAVAAIKNAIYNLRRDESQSIYIEDYNGEESYEMEELDCNLNNSEIYNIIHEISSNYPSTTYKGAISIYLQIIGYNNKEIARHFKTTPNNVRMWISRAKKNLKNEPEIQNLLLQKI